MHLCKGKGSIRDNIKERRRVETNEQRIVVESQNPSNHSTLACTSEGEDGLEDLFNLISSNSLWVIIFPLNKISPMFCHSHTQIFSL